MALSKAARLKLLEKLADHFESKSYLLIDAALEAFDTPTVSTWDGEKYEYVLFNLKDATDEALLGLAEYAGIPDEPPSPATVEKKKQRQFKPFRLFISHISAKKAVASELSQALAPFGIDGFVAHEDIAPTVEWQVEIETRLGACDGLVALLHNGFKKSDWTEQEIGWVLGRRKPVISVRYDDPPYGFFGKSQAFNGNGKTPYILAKEIFRRLAENPASCEAIAHGVVGQFYGSPNFNEANRRAALLPLLKYWDDDLRQKVEAAVQENYEVTHAFDVPGILESLQETWGTPGSVIELT